MAKLLNKDEHAHDMVIEVHGPVPIELDPPRIVAHVEGGAVANVPLRVLTRDASLATFGFEVTVRAEDDPSLKASAAARFIQPGHQP